MNNRQRQLIRLKTGKRECPETPVEIPLCPPKNKTTVFKKDGSPIGTIESFRVSDHVNVRDVFVINAEEVLNINVQDTRRVERYETLGGGPINFVPGAVTTTARLSLREFNPQIQIGSSVRVNTPGLENRTFFVSGINHTISPNSLESISVLTLQTDI